MPSRIQKAIAAVKDQTSIGIAKVSNNISSNLEIAVLKATSHDDDDIPINDRYVCEVLQIVQSDKHHAAACARAIGKRIGRTRNWVVALKSLMLVLRIFQDGDPYFPREVLHAMKRGAKILNLSSFRNDSNSSPWDFTAFVRTFALYLDERLDCFLTGKLQRRYVYGEKEHPGYNRTKSQGARRTNEPVHDMKPAMLLDKISNWQRLLDRAIATRPTGDAKNNRLVKVSLYAIVQESFDLYKDISDGLTLLLDSFFHLQYQNCVSAFQACVKATKQFEELSAFYSLCKTTGVGRSSEYPSVQTISQELIETLQEFLKDNTFISNAKTTNRLMILPSPSPRSSRNNSYGGQSEFSFTNTDVSSEQSSEAGTQCSSLEELIRATETGTSLPSISIDLETYPGPDQQDDAFRISDTGSSRSLPVTNSITDLMSLDDWSDEEDNEHQETPNQKGSSDSTFSKNWELELTETVSGNNNTNSFDALSTSVEVSQPTGSELVLFEAAAPPQQTNNNYNPFLQDLYELPTNIATPTFQAVPTFSNVNDPFADLFSVKNVNDPFADLFSSKQILGASMNQQKNFLQEQELWVQNQNKIIAKHM